MHATYEVLVRSFLVYALHFIHCQKPDKLRHPLYNIPHRQFADRDFSTKWWLPHTCQHSRPLVQQSGFCHGRFYSGAWSNHRFSFFSCYRMPSTRDLLQPSPLETRCKPQPGFRCLRPPRSRHCLAGVSRLYKCRSTGSIRTIWG